MGVNLECLLVVFGWSGAHGQTMGLIIVQIQYLVSHYVQGTSHYAWDTCRVAKFKEFPSFPFFVEILFLVILIGNILVGESYCKRKFM